MNKDQVTGTITDIVIERRNGNTVIVCNRPEGHAEAPRVECLAKVIGKWFF